MVRTDTNTKNESHQEAKVIQHLSLIKGITLVEARNGKGLDPTRLERADQLQEKEMV